jgi:integrase
MPRGTKFGDKDIVKARAKAVTEKVSNRVHVWGHGVHGLYLHSTPPSPRYPEGRQKWVLRYSRPKGRGVTEKKLGDLRYTDLKRAKEIVDHFRRHLNDGQDPVAMQQWNEREQTTFKQVAGMWVENERPGRSEGWVYNAKHLLHDYGADLANLRVFQITHEQIHAALEPRLAAAPEQTHRARRYIKKVLDFAGAKRFRPAGMINPAQWDGLQRYLFRSQPKKGRRHHAAPKYVEVPGIVREVRRHEDRSVGAVAFRFCLYSVTRTSETLKAQWREIDWENKVWTIPEERMAKNDEGEYQVPLPKPAMEILHLRKQQSRGSSFIFTSTDARKHLGPHGMSGLLRRMGYKVTVHGTVRSTFKQWALEQTNYPRELIEMSMAHKVGNAVEQAYARDAQALERRRSLYADWARFCDSGVDWGFLAAP